MGVSIGAKEDFARRMISAEPFTGFGGEDLTCEGERDVSLKYEKGLWWMPRHHQTKKDAASSENLGEAQTAFDPGVSEWGNLAGSPVDL
jgi:hypothetical protein